MEEPGPGGQPDTYPEPLGHPEPVEGAVRTWRLYMLVLGLVVGAILALQIAGIISRVAPQESDLPDQPWSRLTAGDVMIKLALVDLPGRRAEQSAAEAVAIYRQALPWPAAYRRIGITRIHFLGARGISDLERIASPDATRELDERQVARLRDEVRMWREAFVGPAITPARARELEPRIRKLNLGPLKEIAVAEVYERAGDKARAAALVADAKAASMTSLGALGFMVGIQALAALVGVLLVILFLVRTASTLAASPPPRIQPSILILSFLTYILATYVLSVLAAAVAALGGLLQVGESGQVAYLTLEVLATLGAIALAATVLRWLAAQAREDPSEIGLRPLGLVESVKWGVAGYCAVLPLMVVAIAISTVLSSTICRQIPTPEHPVLPFVAEGGLVFVVVFVLGAVIAPIVEEVTFRGMLYGALRARMSVWGAGLLSAAIFALVHPTLPGGFLPIVALGLVFAILRERTGSLTPSMICHGVNNAIIFILVKLV